LQRSSSTAFTFGEHVVFCALGIDVTGEKSAVGFWESTTELPARAVRRSSNVAERGPCTDPTLLDNIDAALIRAARDPWLGARKPSAHARSETHVFSAA